MAIVHEAPRSESRLSRVLTTDFCPWANKFVYWLKEPIGWFALAAGCGVVVGLYISPIGWTIAGSLVAIMVAGILWPLIAVRATACSLHPEDVAVHEESICRMIFSVSNRLPLPVWGLTVEGYLDCEGDEVLPTVGLSCVPPLCTAEYSVPVTPEMRGVYPIQDPKVACSFPFGLYTARRHLRLVERLTVWPKLYSITSDPPFVGKRQADEGDGSRGGRTGDIVGTRPYRQGDSPRHIHWVQSARTDTLIVAERGGPQAVSADIFVDTSTTNRAELKCRMRVAASITSRLHQANIPMRITLGDRIVRYGISDGGRCQILDAFARVPADGEDCSGHTSLDLRRLQFEIAGVVDQGGAACTIVTICDPSGSLRAGARTIETQFDPLAPLDEPIARLWMEGHGVSSAA